MPSPSVAQVREQAVAIRQSVPDARIIGVRADAWSGPEAVTVDGLSFRVAFCPSPLQVREELLEESQHEGLVLLTPVRESDLGSDVLVRLAKRQLFDIDTWRIVLDLFKARTIDPRVRRARWVADALVESAPASGYEPVPAGVLDVDTVWDVLLRLRLGFADGRPDALALLRWADSSTAVAGYLALPDAFRRDVRARIAQSAGSVGETMLDALAIDGGADLVSLGLACRVLFNTEGDLTLRDAAIRFERVHGQHPLPAGVGLQWAEAAERVVAERESADGWQAIRPRVDKADRLLTDMGAGAFLHLGRWSATGFEQRLTRLAHAISADLTRPAAELAAEPAARYALEHRQARLQPARQRRVEMALRLVRWLRTSAASWPSFSAAVQAYAAEGAFVDLARLTLLGDEQPHELGAAYSSLLTQARERRELESERFGQLAAAAGAQVPDSIRSSVPVERVVPDVVASVAAASPVLFLVMDGLSRPVYVDLVHSIGDAAWRVWEPAGLDDTHRWTALAALPSVTEVSRTSLFCGRITAGDASTEAREFAAHAALLQVSRAKQAPLVFHKGALLGLSGRELSTDLRTSLNDPKQQIVAAVVNVVDDLLFKGDQVQVHWDLDAAPVLRALFDAARVAGRAVILTSDHGHLLDDDTAFQGREAGERWREDSGAAGDGEVRVESRRVLARGRQSVVVPWSERTRYSGRRNGYHGGVNPQELVLPLAVLAPADMAPEGFREAVSTYPAWWFESAAKRDEVPLPLPNGRQSKPAKADAPMFRLLEPEAPSAPEAPPSQAAWLDQLFASPVLVSQKALSSGRGLPTDAEVRRLLLAITEHGGRVTRAGLTQRLGIPVFRLAGLVAATRRLLNVDGLQVLDVDEASDTVVLNRALLNQQFEVQGS